MKTNAYRLLCLVFVLLGGCASAVKQEPVHSLTEFTLSTHHRTEGLFTLVSIEPDGRVRARIFQQIYFARVGEWFVVTPGDSPSEYLLKSVNPSTGEVVIQCEARR